MRITSVRIENFRSIKHLQTRILTEAAIAGRVDYLRGLKENVFVDRLIAAFESTASHSTRHGRASKIGTHSNRSTSTIRRRRIDTC
jgi:hypothetical protein